MSRFLDLRHPFFVPLWRRVLIVLVFGGWAVFEFVSGSAFWGAIFAAGAVWCAWSFFVTFDPDEYREKRK